jgi:YggT family protein
MTLVHDVINLYIFILIVSALLSWFPSTSAGGGLSSVRRVLFTLTEPVLRPIRAILPRPQVGGVGIDFSVLVAIIGLGIINTLI